MYFCVKTYLPFIIAVFVLLNFIPIAQSAPTKQLSTGHGWYLDEPIFSGKAFIYEEGRNNPTAIVLIHGIGANAGRDWKYVIPELSKKFHVVVIDLPGFGKSTQGNELYTPSNYVKFVRYATQQILKKPFTLVGHSLGSNISLLYAATYPDDVERLAVADVAGLLHYLSFIKSITNTQLDRVTGLYGMRERLGTALGIVFDNLEKFNTDPIQILESSLARQRILQGNPRNIAGLGVALENFNGKLERIKQPTLIIWGRRDEVTPLRTANLLIKLIPNAQLQIIEEAAHTPMLETPDPYNEILKNFLSKKNIDPSIKSTARTQRALGDRSIKFGNCNHQSNLKFEGTYERIELRGCKNVIINNARIGFLEIIDSDVDIENTDIAGDVYGVQATRSKVLMTNGSISASTALVLSNSRMDFAGVQLRGHERIAYSFESSVILCSLCKLKSSQLDQDAHDLFRLEADNAL